MVEWPGAHRRGNALMAGAANLLVVRRTRRLPRARDVPLVRRRSGCGRRAAAFAAASSALAANQGLQRLPCCGPSASRGGRLRDEGVLPRLRDRGGVFGALTVKPSMVLCRPTGGARWRRGGRHDSRPRARGRGGWARLGARAARARGGDLRHQPRVHRRASYVGPAVGGLRGGGRRRVSRRVRLAFSIFGSGRVRCSSRSATSRTGSGTRCTQHVRPRCPSGMRRRASASTGEPGVLLRLDRRR